MRLVPLKDIQARVSFPAAIDAVREAFIAYSKGLIHQPAPMQILFTDQDGGFTGDCHVKAAQRKEHPYFVIKVASGFYNNVAKGLPPGSGLVVVMSSETGLPVALLQDEGWLTQIRTAAAGTLAASLKQLDSSSCLGLIGTGVQAFLHAQFISARFGLKKVAVLGRTPGRSAEFCGKLIEELSLDAVPVISARDLCHASSVVVTATPSTSPLITADDLPSELHIVAVGTDSPGKSELAPSVLAKADIVVTDDHTQCLHHGDFGNGVRAGVIDEHADHSLCHILAGKHPDLDFGKAQISLVDLTGLGAQDLAVASLVANTL